MSKDWTGNSKAVIAGIAPSNHSLKDREKDDFYATDPKAVDMLCDLQKQNLERIEKEIEWFTLKFDYRNQSKPWGNSQDSVERTINKLRGACVGDLKIPEE